MSVLQHVDDFIYLGRAFNRVWTEGISLTLKGKRLLKSIIQVQAKQDGRLALQNARLSQRLL